MKQLFISVLLAVLSLLPANSVFACPDIDGLVDLNCDGKLLIVAFGDSITFGRADTAYLGGYPGRLGTMLPHSEVVNLGRPGENSYSGRSRASQQFPWFSYFDYFIILEGVNDFWMSGHTAPGTRSNLLQMVHLAQTTGAGVLLGNLTAIRRSNQQPWVSAVNAALAPYRSIDFYALGEAIISGDQIHPSPWGYQRMADTALAILQAAGALRRPADLDQDGIYDFAEPRYQSSASTPDTDGDGLRDGDEVFVYRSSPISTDSDADGFSDDYEVNVLHSDPANPLPGPPRLDRLEIIPNT